MNARLGGIGKAILSAITETRGRLRVDLSVDSELGINALLQDSILKEIPLMKSVVSFYNIANSVIDRHKVIKTPAFFQEFHRKEINQDKLDAFKVKFSKDGNYQDKVVETIILLNERFLQTEKSKILANLIKAHIEENITWQELQDISFVLDAIHPKGFVFLEKISKNLIGRIMVETKTENLLCLQVV